MLFTLFSFPDCLSNFRSSNQFTSSLSKKTFMKTKAFCVAPQSAPEANPDWKNCSLKELSWGSDFNFEIKNSTAAFLSSGLNLINKNTENHKLHCSCQVYQNIWNIMSFIDLFQIYCCVTKKSCWLQVFFILSSFWFLVMWAAAHQSDWRPADVFQRHALTVGLYIRSCLEDRVQLTWPPVRRKKTGGGYSFYPPVFHLWGFYHNLPGCPTVSQRLDLMPVFSLDQPKRILHTVSSFSCRFCIPRRNWKLWDLTAKTEKLFIFIRLHIHLAGFLKKYFNLFFCGSLFNLFYRSLKKRPSGASSSLLLLLW